MSWFDRFFGQNNANKVIASAEAMLRGKVDEANRLRAAQAIRLTRLENRLRELHRRLERGDVVGIERRQAEEDFNQSAKAIHLSRKEAALLNQSIIEAEESRAKARELVAARGQANEADLLVQLKVVMDDLEQKRKLTQLAMADLRGTEMSVAPAEEMAPADQLNTAAVETMAPPAIEAGEAAKAAERKKTMDDLLGPMPG